MSITPSGGGLHDAHFSSLPMLIYVSLRDFFRISRAISFVRSHACRIFPSSSGGQSSGKQPVRDPGCTITIARWVIPGCFVPVFESFPSNLQSPQGTTSEVL